MKFYGYSAPSALWKPTRPNRRRGGRAGSGRLRGSRRAPRPPPSAVPDLIGVHNADKPDRPGRSRLGAFGPSHADCCMHFSRPNFSHICCDGRVRLYSVQTLQQKNSTHIYLSTSFVPPFMSPSCPIPHFRQIGRAHV